MWLLLLLNDFGERYARRRVQTTHLGESIALLRLARRVADVLVLCAGGLMALAYLGVDATAALAGLGIGGIAVALAAQKTLENVIGGFSLVFDKAVRVGDFLKLGTTMGTVDRVGLRSTRIRTAGPNDDQRAQRHGGDGEHRVASRIATSSGSVTSSASLRNDAGTDARRSSRACTNCSSVETGVETESVRARFFHLGPSSLDIEVVAYFFALDWSRFLEIQEALLLRIMEIIDQAGTSIAFPSQTLYVSDDRVGKLSSHDAAIPTVST